MLSWLWALSPCVHGDLFCAFLLLCCHTKDGEGNEFVAGIAAWCCVFVLHDTVANEIEKCDMTWHVHVETGAFCRTSQRPMKQVEYEWFVDIWIINTVRLYDTNPAGCTSWLLDRRVDGWHVPSATESAKRVRKQRLVQVRVCERKPPGA